MSLHNAITSGNYILAGNDDAVAISELITQELVDNDFVAVKNIRTLSELENISYNSSADELITSNLVQDGDTLLIRKNDGSFHELVVSGSTPITTAGIIPTMRSYTTPRGTVSATVNASGVWPWQAFDGNSSTYGRISAAGPGHIEYRFKDDELIEVTQYYLKAASMSSPNGWEIHGSTNGVDWEVLAVETTTSANGFYDITQNIAAYNRYRLYVGDDNTEAYSWNLLGDGVSIDTSAVTAGEVPDQVFHIGDTISFNDQPAIRNFTSYEFGYNATRLHVFSQYNDVIIPDDGSGDGDGSRTVTTKIEFKATGNAITEITADIHQAESAPAAFSVSKATAVNNAVTIYFPSDMTITGDLTASCSIKIDAGANIYPDTATPNDDFIVFNFPVDTIAFDEVVTFEYDDTLSDITQAGTGTLLVSGSSAIINTVQE